MVDSFASEEVARVWGVTSNDVFEIGPGFSEVLEVPIKVLKTNNKKQVLDKMSCLFGLLK